MADKIQLIVRFDVDPAELLKKLSEELQEPPTPPDVIPDATKRMVVANGSALSTKSHC